MIEESERDGENIDSAMRQTQLLRTKKEQDSVSRKDKHPLGRLAWLHIRGGKNRQK